MRKEFLLCLGAAFLFAAPACNRMETEAVVEQTVESVEPSESSIVSGEMIVQFSDDMVASIEGGYVPEYLGDLKVTGLRRLYSESEDYEARHRAFGLHKWYVVEYDETLSYTKASMGMGSISGVDSVEPVRRVKPTAVFNDPYLYKQWGYVNSTKTGYDIGVEEVWKNYTGGSSEVIVSIVDGGIQMDHPDLQGVVIAGGKEGSKNFVDGNYNIVAHDHGTHVAGTVGAINNNGVGVCGVAGGTDGKGGVKLLSCQVFKTNTSTGKDVSASNFGEAMIWGADHGAVISQNSWGYVYDTAAEAAQGSVGSMKSAIDYFITYAGCDSNGNQLSSSPMKGGIVFFAAGNDGWPDGWPAEYSAKQPLCVAIGAFDENGQKADFSNYGSWVKLCAPGVGIYSTIPTSTYASYNGTSMACPHASGVAALVVSYCGGQGFTNQTLYDKLIGGASKTTIKGNIGSMVNALGAITYGASNPPVAVSDYTLSVSSNVITYDWKVTSDPDDKKAYAYALLASKDKSLLTSYNPRKSTEGVVRSDILVGDKAVGDAISGTVDAVEFESLFYTAIFARDYGGNYSSISPIKSITTLPNNPPVVKTDYTGDYVLKAYQTLQVEYNIYDPDGHAFTVAYASGDKRPEKPGEASSSEFIPNGNYRVSIVGPNCAEGGEFDAAYTVKDSYGAQTVYPIHYEILANNAPSVKKTLDNMVFESLVERLKINMDDYITDVDGEQLTYAVSMSPKGIVQLNQVDNVLNLTTLDFGSTDITITAVDACKASVEVTFKVRVRDPESDPDIYPNVLGGSNGNVLYLSDGSLKNISVKVVSASGAVVATKEDEGSLFKPLEIDFSSFAPGRYGIVFTTAEKTYNTTVIKK